MANYPTSLDSLSNPSGTSTVADFTHSGIHGTVNDIAEALEAKVGVGAGTPTANKILVGSGNGTSAWSTTWNAATLGSPIINGGTISVTAGTLSGVLVGTSTITGGTISAALIGTSQITGGSIAAAVIGTPAITGGTVQNVLLGTSTITGGTASGMLMGTSSIIGGTLNSVAIGTPTTNNYSYNASSNISITSTSYTQVSTANLKGTLTLTGNSKVRVSFHTNVLSSSGTPTFYWQVVRDPAAGSVTLFDDVLTMVASTYGNVGATFIDAPAAASAVYAITAKVNQGTAILASTPYYCSFALEEIKAG